MTRREEPEAGLKVAGQTETIDEFETRKEAMEMLREYELAYRGTDCRVWVSQRPCRDWTEES